MKPIQLFAILALVVISMVGLTGCAGAGDDADSVSNELVQGLMGQGTLYKETPMKDSFGPDF